MFYVDEMLLHVSRGVRWDSDHVVDDDGRPPRHRAGVVRGGFLDRVHIGLDYFDASINRIAAYVVGTRNMQRALLMALLEPIDPMRALEHDGDSTGRLALLEELKGLPFGAVWDYHCLTEGVPVGMGFMDEVRTYERTELAKRA